MTADSVITISCCLFSLIICMFLFEWNKEDEWITPIHVAFMLIHSIIFSMLLIYVNYRKFEEKSRDIEGKVMSKSCNIALKLAVYI